MPALDTVQNYLDQARILLQDKTSPFRYSDDELVGAMNVALLEVRRLRPDLFLGRFDALPFYSSASPTAQVVFEAMYRPALLFFIIGFAQLRDEEDTADARAAALMGKFTSSLLTLV